MLVLFPADRLQPGTSTLNFTAGRTRANNAILLLSATPEQVFTAVAGMAGSATADLVVDVNGYSE